MSKSYIEVKEEEQKIALNISMIEFQEKTQEIETPKEEVCLPKESPKKIKEIKKERKVVEKKAKEEIVQEKKVENIVEVKKEQITQNRDIVPVKQLDETPKQIQKTAPSEPLKQPSPQEEYSEINSQKILELLRENLYYPISARKRNITGVVKVSFTLDTNAKVCNIHVVDSGSDILSRAAITTIEELSEKFPKPNREITLTIPINYKLK
jgi:protein TonB